MGSLVRTLNAHCSWTEILDALGVLAPSSALPARVRCPLCKGPRLNIYEDNISGGSWHYCFDCLRSGDMIELAAAVWETSPQAALRRLMSAGVTIPAERVEPDAINRYVVDHPQYRNRLTDFWGKARSYLMSTHTPDLNNLRVKFRLHSQMAESRWEKGPGQFVGAYPFLGVERVFLPNSIANGRCVSANRVFRNGGWKDVLVIPYHDLPGRICGFQFVGRNGLPEDHVFRVPHMRVGGKGGHYEGGLACYYAAFNSKAMFGQSVVAVNDPMFAIRLQIRHFAGSETPLPLVAYHDDASIRTHGAWASLTGKVPVLWGWRMTPSLLHQAIVADGMLSVSKLEHTAQSSIDHYVRNNEPRDLLRKAVKRALPWRDALKEWADETADGTVEDLLSGMEAYGHDMEAIAQLGPRLRELARLPMRARTVPVGNKKVIEQNGKWYVESKVYQGKPPGPPELIMDATLRVLGTAIHRRSTNKGYQDVVFYKLRMTFRGVEHDFESPVNCFHDRTAEILTLEAARAVPGAALRLGPGWGKKLIDAAMQFGGT